MLPTEYELQKLEAMMNNAIAATPMLTIYLDPFKIMRIAKESVELAEMYFRQGQKRYIKTEQEKAQQNAQMNNEANQQSIMAKAQADEAIEKKNKELIDSRKLQEEQFKEMKKEFTTFVPITVKMSIIPKGLNERSWDGLIYMIDEEEEKKEEIK